MGNRREQSISVNQSGTYSVTSSLTSCACFSNSASAIVSYDPDCCYDPSATPYDNYTVNINTLLTNNIIINGTFTIAPNVTVNFSQCHVQLGAHALIQLSSNSTLNISNYSYFNARRKMWQGIDVPRGAYLSIDNSTIKDAQYAVTAHGGSNLTLGNCNFVDNYVSLMVPLSTTPNTINSTMKYVNFSCTGSVLAPVYPGQTPSLGNRSLAGIYLINATSILIGNSLNTPGGNITFNNLSNGIISVNSQVTVNNSYFYNMIADNTYNTLPIFSAQAPLLNGSGIFSRDGYLEEIGLGKASSYYTFRNCAFGISKLGSETSITNNRSSDDVRTGIYLSKIKSSANIKNNNWNCRTTALWLYDNPSANILIQNNDLRLSSRVPGFACVRTEEPASSTNNIQIINNSLTLNRGQYGIYMNNISKSTCQSNTISMNGGLFNRVGINLVNGQYNTIRCNSVLSTIVPQSTRGMYFSMTQDNEIACNVTDRQTYGFQFNLACYNTRFKGNEINNQRWGLYVNSGSNMGIQRDNGNLFAGPFSNLPNHYGAFMSGVTSTTNPLAIALNRFIYDPNGSAFLHTSNNVTAFPFTLQWFDNTSTTGNTFKCENYVCQAPVHYHRDINPLDALIAKDSIPGSEYMQQNQFIGNKYLLEKLMKDTSLININPLFRTFYEEKLNGNIGRFVTVEDSISMNSQWEGLYETNYTINTELIQQYLDSISYTDSLINAEPSNNNVSDWNAANDSYNNSIAGLMEYNDSLLTIIKIIKQNNYDQILDKNNEIVPNEVYEENEKIINGIYLSTIAKDFYEFNQDQVNSIYDIAWQCPFLGGPAVYTARSLYALMDDTTSFDDELICAQQGIALRSDKHNEALRYFSLYPNPVRDQATLEYELKEGERGELIIIDAIGRLQFRSPLFVDQKLFLFSTKQLSNSIYYFNVMVNDEVVGKGKIAIIR